MKFSIKNSFSKCDQIRSFLWIWSHILNKSLMENFFLFGGKEKILLIENKPLTALCNILCNTSSYIFNKNITQNETAN